MFVQRIWVLQKLFYYDSQINIWNVKNNKETKLKQQNVLPKSDYGEVTQNIVKQNLDSLIISNIIFCK